MADTEGRGGLGWAVDAIPALENGSTIGIPSQPAILMPDGRIVEPDLRDAERMQTERSGHRQSLEQQFRQEKSRPYSVARIPLSVFITAATKLPSPSSRSAQ